VQHWVCLQAEQALDAELAIDVLDDGASPMEEDVLPEAACPGTLPADDRADDTVTVISEASTKAGHKRKQQHSSTTKLPRCVLDGFWAARLHLLHLHWLLATFSSTDMMSGSNCSVQPQNSLKLLPDNDHSNFCCRDNIHLHVCRTRGKPIKRKVRQSNAT